jgi:predicted RNA-binding protein associated with RNAse of E/G family
VSGNVIADNGYLAIWFIYRNKWYDVGKFFDRSRNWIGYYCDILKPPRKLLARPSRTTTLTDLFLDLWITPGRQHFILDEYQLELALRRHEVSESLARKAREQMMALVRRVDAGRFPLTSVRKAHLICDDAASD